MKDQPGDRSYPPFPKLEEDIGHNPARFLDIDSTERTFLDSDVEDGRVLLLEARIRGIDRIEVLRAYEAVERNPRVGPKEGPRSRVLELLEEREAELREIGERPDRLEFGPRLPPEWFDSTSAVERRERTAADRLHARRRAATDGGESE